MNFKEIKNNIPLNSKTAYLCGVIIGDGYITDSKKSKKQPSPDHRISIDISDKKFLNYLYFLIKTIVETKSKPRNSNQRKNTIPRLTFNFRNKELYYFFRYALGIPAGNKSSIVSVPPKITDGTRKLKRNFIAGYFDADGGFRGGTLGFTTASKKMQSGVSNILEEFDIEHSLEKWLNKIYNKEFYGIRFRKKEIGTFLKLFPLRNEEKLYRIKQRFMRRCQSGQLG